MPLDDKIILLTGGTGSFGQTFTRIALEKYDPHAIRIFSRGEHKQCDMERELSEHTDKLRFFVGDIRNLRRLERAMEGVDLVIHAAAMKRVPKCEYNPIEAVRTNIDGAANVIDAAIDHDVERVIAISTDKAVHAVNLYGSTKQVAEKLFVQSNAYAGGQKTSFSCIRYGNVVGSNGSVIPLFKEQRKEGTLTITDKRMTRFWITKEQGSRHVINGIEKMQGGEIFVPKIPSMKITDLADAIAPEAEKEEIGIRPGEKIHEVLLTEQEARHALELDDYFVIEPEFDFWSGQNHESGESLPDGFRYSSDENDEWLTKDELKNMTDQM
jgi:UDP-N-acetylglucosamine 4,6-dehydratase (inverting)